MKYTPKAASGLKAAALSTICLAGGTAAFALPIPSPIDELSPLEYCQLFEQDSGMGDKRIASLDQPFMGQMTRGTMRVKFDCSAILGQANIASFMQNLASYQTTNMPQFTSLLAGSSSGAIDVQTSQGNSDFSMATPDSLPVWARLQSARSESAGADITYFAGAAGAHYRITPDAIVGLMLEFDSQTQENGDFKVDGSGYMAGPYFAAKVPAQPVYIEGSYLVGTATSTLSFETFGEPEEAEFETDRALASIRIAGDMAYGEYTLTPSLAASQLKSTQKAIATEGPVDIPEQSITTQDVAIGLDLSRILPTQSGTLEFAGGLTGIFSSTDGTGLAEEIPTNFEGERARIHLGTRYTMDSGMILTASTSYDGIGADDYKSIGIQLQLEMSF